MWGLALLFLGARAQPGDAVSPALDVRHPPARIGQALADVLSNWGERATFGADCGSWRGPSVDLEVAWQGEPLRVMALLQGDRVTALRYEQTLEGTQDAAQCVVRLDVFQRKWREAGVVAGDERERVYDGPVIRAARSAVRAGFAVGSFEADYRQSRTQCRVALVVTRP